MIVKDAPQRDVSHALVSGVTETVMEIERSVVGGILRYPAALDEVRLVLKPDDFASGFHSRVFASMLFLSDRNRDIDLSTVYDHLVRVDSGEADGRTRSDLHALWNENPTGIHTVYHASMVRESSGFRQLRRLASDLDMVAERPTGPFFEVVAEAEQKIFALADTGHTGTIQPFSELIADAADAIDLRTSNQSPVTGISTGLDDLDFITAGFQPGEVSIIASRPSVGKTSLGIHFATNALIKHGIPVMFSSLEQTRGELAERMISYTSLVDSHRIRTGRLSGDNARDINDARELLAPLPMFIDDTAQGHTVHRIAHIARQHKRKHGIGLLVVDYLQLIEPDDRRAQRHEQVGAISRRLKLLAKELGIPVVVMAQLNRASEEHVAPRLSDLRESGSIEQDADVVMLMNRVKDEGHQSLRAVLVAKNRNGRTGEITVVFDAKFMRFENFCPNNPHL